MAGSASSQSPAAVDSESGAEESSLTPQAVPPRTGLALLPKYGKGLLLAALVLTVLAGSATLLLGTGHSGGGGHRGSGEGSLRAAELDHAVTLVAPTNITEFKQQMSAVTRGRSWAGICEIYRTVLSPSNPPAGAHPEVLDLRTYYQSTQGDLRDLIKIKLTKTLAVASIDCGPSAAS
jgi:hypothetical protein